MLEQFKISQSNDPAVRAKAIPILFFESKNGGERTFHGYGTVESVKLVTQYTGVNNQKEYFSNYLFTFCVFSLKKEQEAFDWSWIDAFVTMSYFTDAAQKEVLENNYPIMLINGKQVVKIVREHIYKENISIDEYLNSLNTEQSYEDPADILKEE